MLTLSICTGLFSFFLLSASSHSVILSFSCSLWSSVLSVLMSYMNG